jgi:hypothetical protein
MESHDERRFQVGDLVRFRRGSSVRLNYDIGPNEIGTISGVEPRRPAEQTPYRIEVKFTNALVSYTSETGFELVIADARRRTGSGTETGGEQPDRRNREMFDAPIRSE